MQFDQLKRREFFTLVGGTAAVWPLEARAQQPAMPVIGFLSVTFAHEQPHWLAAFHRGLSEAITSRARTWRSSTAGPRIKGRGCQRWRPNWFAGRSRRLV
jgi:hypothetical protein